MGGKVFSAGHNPLYTPRMVPAVYEHVKKQCISALTPLFSRVESPVEAPEKASFGDIDILASLEGSNFPTRASTDPSVWTRVQEVLGGVRSHHEARTGADGNKIIDSKNFAIPWPTDLSADECAAQILAEADQSAATVTSEGHVQGNEARETGSHPKARYIQVDVNLCGSNEEFDWRRFKHGHGDLWNMLGQTIRPFGLTADETSLSIRIPEIEKENKKRARVFLTNNPIKTLDFLGLSHQNGEWERPLKSVEDLFEYAASCRWFMLWPQGLEADEKAAAHEKKTNNNSENASTKNDGNNHHDAEIRSLKANDRARMKKRPLFARWANEFRTKCREQGRFLVPDPDKKTPEDVRDEVRALAFRAFPGSEAAYAATLTAWRREKVRTHVKSRVIRGDMCLPADISHALPAPPPQDDAAAVATATAEAGTTDADTGIGACWRGVLHSALAKILIDDDEGFGAIVPPRLRDSDGLLVVEDVKDWISRHWEEVGRIAWELQCEKVRAKRTEGALKGKIDDVAGADGEEQDQEGVAEGGDKNNGT